MANVIKKVSESKVKSDKNGREYKTCTFAKMQATEMNVPGVGIVAVNQPARETSINLYSMSYLDDKEQFGYSIPAGTDKHSYVLGDIVTRTVEPYSLNSVDKLTGEVSERQVNTFTTVVFGNSDAGNWESLVQQTFKSRGHAIVSKDSVESANQIVQEAETTDLIA
jgi:hypothetical protein